MSDATDMQHQALANFNGHISESRIRFKGDQEHRRCLEKMFGRATEQYGPNSGFAPCSRDTDVDSSATTKEV
jgi:hypothetical protein